VKRTFIFGFLILIAAGCAQKSGTENVAPPLQQVDTATPVPPMPELTTAPPLHVETSLARRITVEEAKAAVDRGEAVLVDVRTAEAYAIEHARGAVSLPEEDLVARANALPREKLIITYCT
jgi:hypothetical protein